MSYRYLTISLFLLSIFLVSSAAFFSAPPVLAVACLGADETCRPSSACSGPTEIPIGLCSDNITTCCKQTVAAAAEIVAVKVKNPIAFTTVEGVLDSLLGSLQAIIAILSIIFIVIGGILYMTAAGDEGRLKTAKSVITAAIVGLALGIAAPSFLKQIGDILGWGPLPPPVAKTLAEIATSVLNFLLSIVGVVGVIMLVVGGLMYLTSAGDEDRIDTGKKIVKYSIIGIAVALAALVIVTQLATFFS